MGKFEIRTDKSEKYRFNLKVSNGQMIGNSEMYSSSYAMENGIASIKK